jgi:hypothetical protein
VQQVLGDVVAIAHLGGADPPALAGEMDPDEAMGLIEAGTQPLNDLIAAMHTKALVAELERRRGSGQDGSGDSGRD